MVTYSQYMRNHRKTKVFKSSTPKFEGSPFKNGTCVRVGTVKPKKPNSAQRKIAKVQLTNERFLIAYIPGFGHNLKKNSEVMVRGGRVPDLPGCRYHIMRNKKDLNTPEAIKRTNRRSKYGLRHPSKGTKLTVRSQHRIAKREKKKAFTDWDTQSFKSRTNFLKYQYRKLNTFFNA
jgi:small subunit ribosomal protein S12